MFKQITFICMAFIVNSNAYTNSDYSNFGSSSSSFSNYGGGGGDQKSYGGGSLGGLEQPQVIEVSPDQLPVQVHFRTASSRLNVQQSHAAGAMAPVEHASFQDEPHRVVHEVVKPVIQEVREIIQPYRRVTQEIRPVIEEVHTVVHKGDNRGGRPGSGLQGKSGGFGGGGNGGAQYAKSKAK